MQISVVKRDGSKVPFDANKINVALERASRGLDDQIAKTFKACGAVSETESDLSHAQSGAQLRQLLGENHRYIFA